MGRDQGGLWPEMNAATVSRIPVPLKTALRADGNGLLPKNAVSREGPFLPFGALYSTRLAVT